MSIFNFQCVHFYPYFHFIHIRISQIVSLAERVFNHFLWVKCTQKFVFINIFSCNILMNSYHFFSNYLLVVSYYNCIVFVRPMSFDISLGRDILSGLQVNISGLIYWLLRNIASTSLLCITSCWCLCLISLLLILFVFMSLNLIELPLSSWDKIRVKTTLYHSNTNHVKSCKIWWNPYRIVSCPTS